MLESNKKRTKVLFEETDILLGPGDRAFEPHYSDQNPSEINDFRGIFLLVHKDNPRLCRGQKKAYGEGKSRQEKVSELK